MTNGEQTPTGSEQEGELDVDTARQRMQERNDRGGRVPSEAYRQRVRRELAEDPETQEKIRRFREEREISHSDDTTVPPAVTEGRLDPQVLGDILRESIEDDIEQQGGTNG